MKLTTGRNSRFTETWDIYKSSLWGLKLTASIYPFVQLHSLYIAYNPRTQSFRAPIYLSTRATQNRIHAPETRGVAKIKLENGIHRFMCISGEILRHIQGLRSLRLDWHASVRRKSLGWAGGSKVLADGDKSCTGNGWERYWKGWFEAIKRARVYSVRIRLVSEEWEVFF